MSPQQALTWSDLATRVAVPVLLSLVSAVVAWSATELGAMKREITELRIEVSKLQVELRMHRESDAQ